MAKIESGQLWINRSPLCTVTVKAWKLHSGKAGLVGSTLLIYLCAESILRYYR